jgi:initiation factor 1A
MVKNSGGNKAKKQARKSSFVQTATQNVRYVKEEGEMYAIVSKIYGGKNCQVMCDDGISRRCTIRRKFTTAKVGSNMIAIGTWLLVGLYDWEVRSDRTQTCDVLEIYSQNEKEKLKQTVSESKLKYIIEVSNNFDGVIKNASEFVFSDTLAEINEDDDGDDDDDDEDDVNVKEEDSSVKVVEPVKDTSVHNQMDWMRIDEDDI